MNAFNFFALDLSLKDLVSVRLFILAKQKNNKLYIINAELLNQLYDAANI